jgi:hypothetical protein
MRQVKWERPGPNPAAGSGDQAQSFVAVECTMKLRILVVLSVLAFVASSLATAADGECPVQSYDEIAKAVHNAPSCGASLAIFERCGSGATSDVTVGEIVVGKCEAVFEGKLSAARKRAYDRAQTICEKKYIKETGSMYRSFEAFCYAKAAANVAKQFSKTSPAIPAKK